MMLACANKMFQKTDRHRGSFSAAPQRPPGLLRQKRAARKSPRLRILLGKIMFHEIDHGLMIVIRNL